jgi:membrane protein implicated in regulation of membrane protease activity
MAAYLMWAIAGFVLIIAEPMTAAMFYLLVIGVAAALAAAVVATLAAMTVQVMIARKHYWRIFC